MKELFDQYPQAGEVSFISIRPGRREAVVVLNEVVATATKGLDGDRYQSPNGARQVTLIQSEHLKAIASYLGQAEINPSLTRRNIVVKGINLITLKGKKFRVGSALLEYSGECHPCSRMEENLGTGGYNAMRGHGGITARVLETGLIRLGDKVEPVIVKAHPD